MSTTYYLTLGFRPFGYYQNTWCQKVYTFSTDDEMLYFFRKLPKWRKHYPFSYTFARSWEGDIK